MINEIFIAGSGGQGVLSFGRVLVMAAAYEDKYATYYPSYGAEVRGGTANCMIKISDEKIYSPLIENPTEMVLMNMPSYNKFLRRMIPEKYLFLNTSLIAEDENIKNDLIKKNPKLKIIEINASEIADNVGNILVSNMVMLGRLLKEENLVKIYTLEKVFLEIYEEKIAKLNIEALNRGYNSD